MKKKKKVIIIVGTAVLVAIIYALVNWGSIFNKNEVLTDDTEQSVSSPVGPSFNSDSAYAYCKAQCEFGPRTMNSTAHDECEQYIISKFKHYGMSVIAQKTVVKGYDGTRLNSTNVIASYKPELTTRILICAHWDSRPWADNDPDKKNHHKPVMAANDGASGVAVMMEIARNINKAKKLNIGVDFICLDAEDWGTPQWSKKQDDGDSWALGAQYWAANPHKKGYEARYGILLDMVGGQGARFYQEGMSKQYAQAIVDKVWKAASDIGYASYFPTEEGGMITDDHIPINQKTNIPTIDIIPYYPDCKASSFGPTWHTVSDDMDHIDKNTMKAVGQTVIQVLYTEK
jgi:Zn-dependent M28 family amino/carboxypeptidase